MLTLKRLAWLKAGAPPRNVTEAALSAKLGGGGASYEKTVGPSAIVSVSDAKRKPALSLLASMEPIQDLHGYSNPWPAGGGKNLIPTTLSLLQSRNTSGTWTDNVYAVSGLTFTVNADGTITVNGTSSAAVYFNFVQNASSISMSAGDYVLHATGNANINISAAKNNSYWGSATTSDVALNADSDFYFSCYSYVASGKSLDHFVLKPMFEAGSTASSWTPYSNICPITGHTGLTAYRTGKNLIKVSSDNYYDGQRSTVDYTDSGVTITATNNYGRASYVVYGLKVGTSYTISLNGLSTGDFNLIYINYDNPWSTITRYGYITLNATASNRSFTFTAVNSILYVGFYVTASTTSGVMTITELQLELGSTASAYESFFGTSFPVTWQDEAGTVFGGTVDVVTGVLTADRALHDLGDSSWAPVNNNEASRTQGLFAAALPSDAYSVPAYSSTDIPDILSDAFKTRANWYFLSPGRDPGEAAFSQYNKQVYVNWSALSGKTNEEAKAALTGVIVCYRLAAPVICQLDPQAVRMLRGSNNLWNDAGDSTVTYIGTEEGE